MKKGSKLLAVLLLLVLGLNMAGCSRVKITSESGRVVYEYDGVSFVEDLTQDELETVIGILNGKVRKSTLVYGVPSCGFNPKIALVIGGTTYMMAQDTCETLKIYGSFDYIDVSAQEQDALEAIFASCGVKFPCI